MVDVPPGATVVGFAEQLMVGGSYCFDGEVSRAIGELADLLPFGHVARHGVVAGIQPAGVYRASGVVACYLDALSPVQL